MSIFTPAAIRAMRAAGMSDTQILDAIEKAEDERVARNREANRKRQAAFQAKRKGVEPNASNADNANNAANGVSDVISVSDADASRTCSNTNLPSEDISKIPPLVPQASEPASRKARRAKARTRLAPDAQPSERDHETARKAGLNAERYRAEWAKFRNHHLAVGSLMADWSAAWAKWCGNISQFNPRAGPRSTSSQSRLVEIAMENFDGSEHHDADHGFGPGNPDQGDGGFDRDVSQRARKEPGGTLLDFRPTASGWR